MKRFFSCLIFAAFLTACAEETSQKPGQYLRAQSHLTARNAVAPEIATGKSLKPAVTSDKFMMTAANPLAVEAGALMLRKGGSAIDAVIAAQAVLNIVEPQSSGIGGGGFALYYNADKGSVAYYDGRETAPASATPDMFLNKTGAPLSFNGAATGGKAVGTPGLLKMLARAHQENGKLPWKTLFTPAVRIAEEGFPLSPRLRKLLLASKHYQKIGRGYKRYTDKEGALLPVGTRIYNKPLAETFRKIAANGADIFYRGAIADDILQTVNTASVAPARMTRQDLSGYQVKKRVPACIIYRAYKVCGPGMPSSGGVTVLQALKMLEAYDMSALTPYGVEAIHLQAEALRLAYADRDKYLADRDFVPVPVEALLNESYLRSRARQINPKKAFNRARPGDPSALSVQVATLKRTESPSTTHLSVIDSDGNAASVTTTIERGFGAGLETRGGFMLNNQMTDFDFIPKINGLPVANAVAPLKRPRSSMAPFIVFDKKSGKPVLVIGSPGGARIIGYVLPRLVAILDQGRPIDEALNAPNLAAFYPDAVIELEKDPDIESLKAGLKEKGWRVTVRDLNSGLHGVYIQGDRFIGAADPRREGEALGK